MKGGREEMTRVRRQEERGDGGAYREAEGGFKSSEAGVEGVGEEWREGWRKGRKKGREERKKGQMTGAKSSVI